LQVCPGFSNFHVGQSVKFSFLCSHVLICYPQGPLFLTYWETNTVSIEFTLWDIKEDLNLPIQHRCNATGSYFGIIHFIPMPIASFFVTK
jgi:hypothetical protein